ncbi:MAG TPA: hypothetical protein VIY27_07965 [Myxococcota bacterium]
MTDGESVVADLLERLGRHPARGLDLDLEAPEGVARWFVAACLLSCPGGERRALDAFRALERAGVSRIDRLSPEDAERICEALERAGQRRPEVTAARLLRASSSLAEAYGGSLETLAAGADDLEALGLRLSRLASGVGAATILRFLRPLRERWPGARDVPLAGPARAAAVHLGLLREGEDPEGEAAALAAALRALRGPPELSDVEAALERLGARACLKNRPERCPLAGRCPGRGAHPPETD